MSTANEVDRVAVPAIRAEGVKDVAVVTPDVVEMSSGWCGTMSGR
jgi:hypothetical protein